ncbi:MAG: GIY-YIG nuclease family protein [Spirochaetes bacterium]|nr:GIY-YIG nuclease family protein [Spirochaetota bacterium]
METKKDYCVYILELENGKFYTGYTTDIERRYREHQQGTAKSKITRSFKPLKIAQKWNLNCTSGMALKIENLIKKQSRKTKEKLVTNPEKLKTLALDIEGASLIFVD